MVFARVAAQTALRGSRMATVARSSSLGLAGARRGYAEAVSDKLKLSFILPHEVRSSTRHFCFFTGTSSDGHHGHRIVLLHLPRPIAIYDSSEVTQVNIASASGDMGILAAHVPSVEELRPGLLEVVESSGTKKWFVSGGFATVHPNNKLVINAIEAYTLDQFSTEAVRSALADAQRVASTASSPEAKAEAEIEVEVYTALQAALSSRS
ncbi:probable ATP synthase delta chain precursor, mitochondrial [Pseudozyma flocculosa]|uniref:ATP synthase subunit delta, mitochondrial n=1 Tax=Pseudozyma flocculosa TaxID=84751 RepID=A0A5C3F8T2_9BASI|nr:probable ATP synthase delta chain precursor, mitochondrial [Pseudozyma flocculosa]